MAFCMSLCLTAVMFCGCGETNGVVNAYRNVSGSVLESQVLASNSGYELRWDEDAMSVIYKSLKNGKYFSDVLYDAFLKGETSANGSSPLLITVVNTKTLKWDTFRSSSEISQNGKILCRKIDGGIRVTYFFDTYKIAIPVDYILNDNSLSVSVDSSKILEDGTDYKLISLSLTPYLCGVENNAENSGVFVPSGTGAIISTKESVIDTKVFSGEVYGVDAAQLEPQSFVDAEQIKLPVFGTYGNDKALFGIIEEGAGAAVIEAQAGNSRLGYSTVYPTFYVRGYDKIFFTNFAKYEGLSKRTNKNISGNMFKVSYYPLYDDDADYNGMAKKYRSYLLEKGELTKSDSDASAYGVTLLGGTNITRSLFGISYKKVAALTTFSEAKTIVEQLKTQNGVSPTVRLMGYSDNGLRPGSIAGGKSFDSVYGKKSQLNDLINICKDTQLFLDFDIVNFTKSGSGVSKNSGAAKTPMGSIAENYNFSPVRVKDNNNISYVIARSKLEKASNVAFKKAEKYNANAISFSSLGYKAFSDYSDEKYMNKNGIEKDVTSILKASQKNGYKTAVSDANSYAACAADLLFDVTTSTGDYDVFDCQIPFYQMVFHSYKPMYSQAVNLSKNINATIAKSAAYGMGLGYYLTYSYVHESDDLDEFALYGTVFDDNAQKINKTLVEDGYLKFYSSIKDAELSEYIWLNSNVSKSVFSNGITVYTNHSNKNVDSPIGKLGAYEYKVG